MADEADRANDQAQEILDATLAAKRTAKRPDPQGYCLAPRCGEDFTDPQRLFCNAQCEKDHDKYQARK